jgi:hypothetical protein
MEVLGGLERRRAERRREGAIVAEMDSASAQVAEIARRLYMWRRRGRYSGPAPAGRHD